MDDPFAGPRLLVNQARQHLATLEAEVKGPHLTMDKALVFDLMPEIGKKTVGMRFIGGFPLTFAGHAFDVVSNARAVLDHATFASAVALGVADPRHTKFPVGDIEADVRGRAVKEMADCDPAVLDIIFRCQPWKGGNEALWAMNKLRNEKLHKLLAPAYIAIAGRSISLPEGWEWGARNGEPYWDSDRNVYFTHTAPIEYIGPGPEMEFQFQVAIGGDNPLTGEPAVPILLKTVNMAERVFVAIKSETLKIIRERGD